MSTTACMLPLLAGLSLFSPHGWQGINKAQDFFLDSVYQHASSLEYFSPEELKACSSTDVNEVNTFLQTNNFAVQLQPGGDDDVYLAAALNIAFEWGFEGAEKTELTSKNDQQSYPAVLVKNATYFQVFRVEDDHREDIFKLPGKREGEYLYISCAPTWYKPDAQFPSLGVLSTVRKIANQLKNRDQHKQIRNEVASVTFPMIDIDQEINLDWMLGMKNGTRFVTQALQQTKFQMNEKGAAVSSGFACRMGRCILEDVVIDKPFFVWIEREGVDLPVFAAYCDESCWKEPVH